MMVLNKHTPVKTKRVKRNTQPEWISDEIKTVIKKRDTFHSTKKLERNTNIGEMVLPLSFDQPKKASSLNQFQKIRTIRIYGTI